MLASAFVDEAIEKIDLPPPWEKRRVRGGDRPVERRS